MPWLSVGEHMANICTLAAGLIVAPSNPVGTLAADVMLIYHEICRAYIADPDLPQPQPQVQAPQPVVKTKRRATRQRPK